jgi:purine nucleoside permease
MILFLYLQETPIKHWPVGIPEFNLLANNITVPGFSPLFPEAYCTTEADVCQLVTGEGGMHSCSFLSLLFLLHCSLEINAASTISALIYSGKFDLTSTYFLIAGVAGVNPKVATLGSVTFARYAIQVALQYEFDAREIPSNFTTGYVPQGATSPSEYPQIIYGTEVFEVNDALRHVAIAFAKKATLNDSDAAIAYRANYKSTSVYSAGAAKPSVVACDVATADVYYSGKLLAEAFENTTTLFTNGTGVYCTSAQEDNATLEVLVRAAAIKLVDFSRIIVMRTASDFDRPYAGESAIFNLFYADQGGFEPAVQNIYLAGVLVVEGILSGWDQTFDRGIKATNYIGDIFGTLGGSPDFGPGGVFTQGTTMRKRGGRTLLRPM